MKKLNSNKKLSAKTFDQKFDNEKDISNYLDFEEAVVVKSINIDLPKWLLDALDKEALKLNVSREAIIKMCLSDKVNRVA